MMARRMGTTHALLLLLLLTLAPMAHAECVFTNGGPSPVNFSVSSPIALPFNLPATGTVLGSPVSASPSNPPDLYCQPNTSYGVVNQIDPGPPTGGSNYIYPTGVAGIGYQLIHNNNTSVFMGPYPTYTTAGGVSTYSVGSTLQLVQTGPIANGATLAAGTRLANWQWGTAVPEYFVLSNQVVFTASACTWDTVPEVVLPTVSSQSLPATNATAGDTAFSITIHCPTGSTSSTLVVNLTATMANGFNHVLKNNVTVKNGGAARVGVELLDPGYSPVVFNSTRGRGNASVRVGPAPTGDGTLAFFARYYATGNVVTAGTVTATATFTLTYN